MKRIKEKVMSRRNKVSSNKKKRIKISRIVMNEINKILKYNYELCKHQIKFVIPLNEIKFEGYLLQICIFNK